MESVKATQESEISLNLPEKSAVLLNPINKEIIERFAKKNGKQIKIKSKIPLKGAAAVGAAGAAAAVGDFGFVEGEDILQKKPEGGEEITSQSIDGGEKKPDDIGATEKKEGGFFKFFSKLKGRKKLLVFGSIGIFLFAILFFTSFWFIPSANVKINIESETISNQITLTASESVSEIDVEERLIPLTVEEVTKSGDETRKSSGKLTIGAPAKGRITVGNFSTVTTKKFPAGTTIKAITGQNVGLEFTLDTEVSVPKASSSGFNIIAGQSGVNATAKAIGKAGNAPASTEFQIASEDIGTIKGVNDLAFTGGESKEVKAVSKDDRKKLKEDLLDKLEDEAKDDLEEKLEGSTVPEGGLKTEVISEKFDKAVGEEADEVKLALEVKAVAKLFQEDDLKKLLIESIQPSIPEGLVVDEENTSVEAELFETEGVDDVEILGKINAVLIPEVNQEDLKKNLSGKTFGSAAAHLQSLNNVPEFEIEIKPAMFRLFKFMPFNSSRINIEIITKEVVPSEDPTTNEPAIEEGKEEEELSAE